MEKEKSEKEEKKIKVKKSKKKIIILSCMIFFVIFILSTIFALVNITNSDIIEGVQINDIDVSSLSKAEAIEKLTNISEEASNRSIILKYEDENITIIPAELEIQYKIEKAVEEAQSIGRNSNIFVNNFNILKTLIFKQNVKMEINIDENILIQKIESVNTGLPGVVEEYSYYIEENELLITKGKAGISVEKDELKKTIEKEIYSLDDKTKVIDIPVFNKEPDEIDIEKIYNEIYKKPENAYVSQDPITVHPNVNGIDFAITIDEAKELLKEDKEEYVIPLKITIAEITLSDLGEEAFPNTLGTFTTRYDASNKNRSNNISVATDKIDGTVILPGETFSYNQILGKRTIEAGYKEAGAYAGGKVVQEVGGGICQVSSTLYNAVLYANLEIVERSSHYFETSYVDAGRDATVSWGTVDFKFKNNRQYPIKIEANSNSGVTKISIKGIYEETEYEVVIQSKITSYIDKTVRYEEDDSLEAGQEEVIQGGHDGCNSEAYKILKLNGNVVSKTLLSKDSYHALEKIVKIGIKKVEEEKSEQEENNTIETDANVIANETTEITVNEI